FRGDEVLRLVASLERYSKPPRAGAVFGAAREAGLDLPEASSVSEPPGQGLRGLVAGRQVEITSRKKLLAQRPELKAALPTAGGGLECVVEIDGLYAATLRFRDEPRAEGAPFITHLGSKHRFDRVLLVSGDRESEVRYLADRVGIQEVYFSQSPEQKLELVRAETRRASTVYVGDG